MKRETRANLIFVAIFLAISLPGAVILFKRKLDPNARRMNMPDPAPQRVAHTGTQIIDHAPRALREWFDRVCRERTGAAALLREGRAIASDNGQVQLVSKAGGRVHVVIWSEGVKEVSLSGAKLEKVERLELPKLAITEMVKAAYAAPPGEMTWVTGVVEGGVLAVTVAYVEADKRMRTSVNLFTN